MTSAISARESKKVLLLEPILRQDDRMLRARVRGRPPLRSTAALIRLGGPLLGSRSHPTHSGWRLAVRGRRQHAPRFHASPELMEQLVSPVGVFPHTREDSRLALPVIFDDAPIAPPVADGLLGLFIDLTGKVW